MHSAKLVELHVLGAIIPSVIMTQELRPFCKPSVEPSTALKIGLYLSTLSHYILVIDYLTIHIIYVYIVASYNVVDVL